MTSDEYYALNQANAARNPVAPVKRPTMDEFKGRNRQTHGYDGTYEDAERQNARDSRFLIGKNWRVPVGMVAGMATLGAGTAAMMGGGAAAGAAGGAGGAALPNGIGGLPAGMGIGGSTITGAGVTAPAGAAASGGVMPWGKIASALLNGGVGGNPHQDALQQSLGSTPPPLANTTPMPTPIPYGNAGKPRVPVVSGAPPAGFDAKNWADPNMDSVKYDAGRLLYGSTKPSEVARRVSSAEFQSRFPGATFDGKDKIDFKGALSDGDTGVPVGLIDVLMAADQGADTSNGLWWGFEPDGGPASPTPAAPAAPSAPMGQLGAGLPGQSDLLAQILASLQTQQAPDPQALLLEQLR